MLRFDRDIDVDFDKAEDKASYLFIQNKSYDFLFEHDLSLYRCKVTKKQTNSMMQNSGCSEEYDSEKVKKILKTKLLCRAVPNMTRIYNKGNEESPAYHYVIKAYSKHDPEGITFEMPGKKLGSHRSFSTALASKVAFACFKGSKSDYDCLLDKMIDQCHLHGQIDQ